MSKEARTDNIHVGHVVIDGAINGQKIKTRYPDYVKQVGEERLIEIEAIVDAYEFPGSNGLADGRLRWM